MSIGIIMLFTWRVHPFYFVLPLNLYEITFHYIEKNWPRFVVMMLPITIADESIRMTYGLIVAFFSRFNYSRSIYIACSKA